MTKKKLVVGITAPGSVNLLRGQLKYFGDLDYETYLLAPDNERTRTYCSHEGCQLLPVKIEREISLFKDVISLWSIIRIFYRLKPDIVNLGTPKMGLLGMIAARITGVKRRIYTCRGFRYEHEEGFKRTVLKTMEWISGFFAQDIICISPSVKERGVRDQIFKAEKCHVIHKGSSNGINTHRFNAERIKQPDILALKQQLNLLDKFIFGFVGRINDPKGISEIFTAFSMIFEKENNIRLLVVGSLDVAQISDMSLIDKMKSHEGIVMPGRTDDVPLYLSLMDVFLLPSWREGFGNVLVEAAAMGIPVISTNGTGTRDAVSDGFNGILVDVKNTLQLTEAMTELLQNDKKRMEMGRNGVEWAMNFDSTIIWEGMKKIYENET